jgi:predicted dehydrogenase
MDTNAGLRWGILSTALIATQKLIPALKRCAGVEVSAIASRNLARARQIAAEHDIACAHGSYEALLADAEVDVVYNPLPNPLHVPLTLAAMRAGKHVLCEKPMAMNAAELEVLRPFVTQVHLQEAFMVRHHPQWLAVRDHLRAGLIGELRYAQMPFSYYNADPGNIRNRADLGGGAIYDIGCYIVAAGRWFFGAEPQRVAATIAHDPALGTDRCASGVLDFGDDRQMTFTVATQAARWQWLALVGTAGRIEIEVPVNAPAERPCRHLVANADGERWITLPPVDQYQLQVEHFSHRVRTQRPDASGLDDARAQARVIDALFAAAASGRFETVATD